jgi:hypothetical protein
VKPTLIDNTSLASAKTYTSYAKGVSVSDSATTAGGGSVLKYTAGSVAQDAVQLRSTGDTT